VSASRMPISSQKAPVTDDRAGLLTQAILFGVHASQVYRYYSTYSGDSLRYKCLVGWIFLLGTLQVLILVVSSWKYYVDGIWNPEVWGTFWWPLSFQDGLVSLLKPIGRVDDNLISAVSSQIPLMGFTCQLYMGRRAWVLFGRKRWFGILMVVLPIITLLAGIA
jgi:hypothetical protein